MSTSFSYLDDSGSLKTEILSTNQASADLQVLHTFDMLESRVASGGEIGDFDSSSVLGFVKTLPTGRIEYWRKCFSRIGVVLELADPKPVDPKTVTTKKSQQGGIK